MAVQNAPKLIDSLVDTLKPREKEVIVGRFGLDKKGEPQTLAALGSRYGITRERIRQIEAAALSALRKEIARHDGAREIVERSKKFLKESGGVARTGDLIIFVSGFTDGFSENHASLLREATGAFEAYPEDRQYWDFYYADKNALKQLQAFLNHWVQHLKNKKEHVLLGRYEDEFHGFVKKKGMPKEHAARFVGISKKIHENPFGDKGLADWPEIKPQTIRDRVYLVLKKKAVPLHFRTIADLINEAGFDTRTASAPTVHNELIKDDRFVLVGRGMYALSESGYEPGTAREVVGRILAKQGPLRPREVIEATLKERFFKPNTILVNLQNKNYFERLPDGTYRARQN